MSWPGLGKKNKEQESAKINSEEKLFLVAQTGFLKLLNFLTKTLAKVDLDEQNRTLHIDDKFKKEIVAEIASAGIQTNTFYVDWSKDEFLKKYASSMEQIQNKIATVIAELERIDYNPLSFKSFIGQLIVFTKNKIPKKG